MFRRILVGLDGTPAAELALRQAIDLARLTGASLTALSVEEKLPAYAASVGEVEETRREMDAFFARVQAAAVAQAQAAGVTLQTVVRAGRAAATISAFAQEGGFDLVVLGVGEGRGLGSTADRVAESAPCSVLIVRSAFWHLRVADVMSREVVTVRPDTPLAEVVELLVRRRLKAVPVLDEGRVVGIITGGDLLQRAGMGLRLSVQRSLPPAELAAQLRELAAQQKTAADVMSQPVITVRADAKVSDAVALMTRERVKRLPVVDEQGALVGIVSRLDVLAAAASGVAGAEALPALQPGAWRVARDVMFRDVPTVSPDASLSEVVERLLATPLRRVVVVDEARRVLGIIVDNDLLARVRRAMPSRAWSALLGRLARGSAEPLDLAGRAADVMERQVYTVPEDAALADVLRTMLEHRVKRVVVTDAQGRLVGMVDRATLLDTISLALQDG
jgi:CBS-domain-containing membrane protein/nucleotide-binding universal stress UspA family protein